LKFNTDKSMLDLQLAKMRKKQLLLIVFVLSFSVFTVQAQDTYMTKQLTDMIGQLNWDRNSLQGNTDHTDIAGSPYLYEDFKNGDVYYDKKFKVENIPLRLNLYSGDFEYMEKNIVMAFSDPSHIDKVVIGDEVFIYLDKATGNQVSGYVKKRNDKLPCLLTKMETEFLNKEDPKPFEDPKPDRFHRTLDKNFIMMSDSEIEKVTTVKKLIKLLGNHSSELTSFAKNEKISSGDPEELVRLLEYFHSLE